MSNMWLPLQDYVDAGYEWTIVDESRLVERPDGTMVMIPYPEGSVVRLVVGDRTIECHREEHDMDTRDPYMTYEIRIWFEPGCGAYSINDLTEVQFSLCFSVVHYMLLVFTDEYSILSDDDISEIDDILSVIGECSR